MNIKTVFIIFILCVLAYAPTLTQPLMEDDYHNISLGRAYGPISGWDEMIADDVNRVRMTSWLMMYTADQIVGINAPPL